MNQKKLRIALFYGSIGGGGAERVLINLAQGFIAQGFETDLVLGKAGGSHMWLVPSQVRVVDLGASGMLDTLPKLIRYLKQYEPNILVSNLHYTNEIALLAKSISRVATRVIVCEQNTLSKAAKHETRLKYRFTPLFAKFLYPWADGIIAASKGVAIDLANITGLREEKIKVIYNPVITPELRDKADEALNHPWLSPGKPPVIIGVGKLQLQKDFVLLIQAFAKVRKVREARLLILGWGPDRPQLEALVSKLDLDKDVALLGHIANPLPYMAKSAVFVLSSQWEGFGNVIVEAMAVGTPVVSTNCPSGPSEILDNGKYGYLTPVKDSSALAEAIIQVLEGKSMSVDSIWLEQFNLNYVTQKYLDAFNIT